MSVLLSLLVEILDRSRPAVLVFPDCVIVYRDGFNAGDGLESYEINKLTRILIVCVKSPLSIRQVIHIFPYI